MLTDLKPGWGSADLDRAQQGGSASGCRLQVLIESVSLPSLEGQAEWAAASLDMLLSWWNRGARESKTEQTKTPKTLMSCQLTSHWPKRATWPSPRSRGEKQSIHHESVARMWTYNHHQRRVKNAASNSTKIT
uniref:Uncharacterized protein n=1 Tax=Rousettus aegyptiacus TaxID=9407 RepID=A0A7J8H0Z2_ROUAE|nr:hypothetical protein HJG63_011186 [Rousettus aegyptiacus]